MTSDEAKRMSLEVLDGIKPIAEFLIAEKLLDAYHKGVQDGIDKLAKNLKLDQALKKDE